MAMDTRRSGAWGPLVVGVVLLVFGGGLLLQNLGIAFLDWGLLWPLVLVAIGVVLLIGALRGPVTRRGGLARATVPADGVDRLELSLRLGAGRYRLRAGGPSLVDASSPEATIAHSVERIGGLARVRLSTSIETWPWAWRTGTDWMISVAPGVPTMVEVQAGAGAFDFDLSGLAVASASMSIGAAELRVVLPHPRGEVPIRVEGGAASFTFEVPAGVEARVTTTGLVTTNGPSQTPGYATAADRVTVSVTGGVAAVRVVRAG